jgi:CheY-like chemotaxis protein
VVAGDGAVLASAPSAAELGGPDKLRVLIAEDNAMNQQVALLLLGAMGYTADVVGNGDEAVAAVRARAYDVVLMDIAMPGTDGISATRAIRALGAGVHQPYIVALTAHAFPGDAESCLAAGMDDYVAKPVERAQLARALAAGADRAAAAGRPPSGGDGGSGPSPFPAPPRARSPVPPSTSIPPRSGRYWPSSARNRSCGSCPFFDLKRPGSSKQPAPPSLSATPTRPNGRRTPSSRAPPTWAPTPSSRPARNSRRGPGPAHSKAAMPWPQPWSAS